MAQVTAGPTIVAEEDPAKHQVAVGGYVCAAAPVSFHANLKVTALKVRNTGDRPIQVGSHFHFFEVNKALVFDREQAYGQRLDLPAGTAVRFEPGDEREVKLVPYLGKRGVYGFNNLVDGETSGAHAEANKARAVERAKERGFRFDPQSA